MATMVLGENSLLFPFRFQPFLVEHHQPVDCQEEDYQAGDLVEQLHGGQRRISP